MKTRVVALFASLALVAAPLLGAGKPTPNTVAAAYVLALGRAASVAEMTAGSPAEASIAGQMAQLATRVKTNAALQREVVLKSFEDAFGRVPTDAEIAATDASRSYTELMKLHVAFLAAHADEYEATMRRAYPLVIHREIYPEEIAYWKKQGVLPFVLLVGCVEDWARRNQPGLMVTTGTPTVSVNSEYLVTVRLSPSEAAEARVAAGLPGEAAPDNAKHHLIAVGAERLTTGGGIYFVAAGRPDLVK